MGGLRRKTRKSMRKNVRTKGKLCLANYFAEFKPGEKVCLVAEPGFQKGMYFPRYHGRMAIIKEKRGGCYELTIDDKGIKKMLVVHPIHLRRVLK
jgi:ribosomal protein L21E